MKKLGLVFGALVAALALGAAPAAAYPPNAATLLLDPGTTTAGSSVAASFTGCTTGETVNFVLNGITVSASCGAAGTANATLTAPAAVGTYPLVATGATSGATATATLTVVAVTQTTVGGTLPKTGSDSRPTLKIAGGLVGVGAGLAFVGIRRRRHASA